MKKIPVRTCVVTKDACPKNELIRVVKDKENNIFVDLTGKANGRGAYLKKDSEVVLKAKKSRILDRKLESSVPDSIYGQLLEIIENK